MEEEGCLPVVAVLEEEQRIAGYCIWFRSRALLPESQEEGQHPPNLFRRVWDSSTAEYIRDIFDPLGMHASFYRMPDDEAVRGHMAIPSTNSEWADIPLGDVLDSSGGQYSSLADLVTLMKTLLSPTTRGGLIPASVAREWLRPLHTWGSGGQEVGAPWEITTLADAKAYTKGSSPLFNLFTYPAH